MDHTASKPLTVFNFTKAALKKFQLHFKKYVAVISRVRTWMLILFNGQLKLLAIVLHLFKICLSVRKMWHFFMSSFYVLLTAKKYTEAVFRLVIKMYFLLPSYFPNLITKIGTFPRYFYLEFYNKIWKRVKEWGCPAWHSRVNELKLRYENRMYRGLKNSRGWPWRIYTRCPRRNVPDFGRVFLMLKYTDITQNTYIQSWTVTEIMAREIWNFDGCYTLIDYQLHIKTGRNMWFL